MIENSWVQQICISSTGQECQYDSPFLCLAFIYGKRIMEKSPTNSIRDFWSLANFGASLISSFLLLWVLLPILFWSCTDVGCACASKLVAIWVGRFYREQPNQLNTTFSLCQLHYLLLAGTYKLHLLLLVYYKICPYLRLRSFLGICLQHNVAL